MTIFPAEAAHVKLNALAENRTESDQAWHQFYALLIYLVCAIIGGAFTGLILGRFTKPTRNLREGQ
jgi:hypothetical protein